MSEYEKRKDQAREDAKEWQRDFYKYDLSWGAVAEIEAYFARIGKRYGLLKEFRENGIL